METFVYKNRSVMILLAKQDDGWVWTYRIDLGLARYSSTRAQRRDEMREEAVAEAKREIDAM